MDLNLVVLAGRIAAPPDLRVLDSGARLLRYLVTVKADEPRRRIDVVPVTVWDPPQELVDVDPSPGQGVWVAGTVQRRFWSGAKGRHSRIEVIADQVCLREPSEAEAVASAT